MNGANILRATVSDLDRAKQISVAAARQSRNVERDTPIGRYWKRLRVGNSNDKVCWRGRLNVELLLRWGVVGA